MLNPAEDVEMKSGTPEMGQSLATTPEMMMVGWMAQVLCVTIRGVLSCFPQVPAEKTLIMLAATMGQQVAATYASDELSVFKFRKSCKDQFCKAMNSQPVASASGPKKTDTASIGVAAS